MKTYTETRGAIKVGDDIKVLTEKQIEKAQKEATENNQPEPELQSLQTVEFVEAETWAEALELAQSEPVAVDIFNRGSILKQQAYVRDLLADPAYQPVEGALDLRASVAEVKERRKATPKEKALKFLAGLNPEDLAAVIAQFASAG